MKNRGLRQKWRIVSLTLLCSTFAALQVADAAVLTVTNTNDSGPGSLRDALTIATADDTITFAVVGSITLTTDELLIRKSVTIDGPGANLLAIDGNGVHRVFRIPGEPGEHVVVFISGLTITNGSGDLGGGVQNVSSDLTLSDCIIRNNSAREQGGGICNVDSAGAAATLTVQNTTITANWAGHGGGAIYNYNAAPQLGVELNVKNSTISGNSAHDGGGIYNIARHRLNGPGSAIAIVSNSTISGNTARGNVGGGVYTEGNSPGLFYGLARLTITNSTISGNSARLLGGGIYTTGGTFDLGQTILSHGASGQNIHRNSGTVTSLGYNLSNDDGGGFLSNSGDQINTDPMLGPLQDNGGSTLTHALLPGSPGVDAGNPGFTPPPENDQRDCPFARVFNGRIDIGSFESQPQPQSHPCRNQRPRPTPRPR